MLSLPFFFLSVTALQCAAEDMVIHSANDLIEFSNAVNSGETSFFGATVLLGSDIDFSEGLSELFSPIGNYSGSHFDGTFDGQGHTISNLAMEPPLQFFGLFGFLGGSIRNVVIDSSCSFTIPGLFFNTAYAGSLIGYLSSSDQPCTIENNVNMADITLTEYVEGYFYLGGIAGFADSSGYESSFKNCANYGSIIFSASSPLPVIGGIIGHAYTTSSSNNIYIQNCLNHGSILYYDTPTYEAKIGGIIGYGKGSLNNCVFSGSISSGYSSDKIGSLIGESSGSTIAHSFWTKEGYDICGSGGLSADSDCSFAPLSISLVDDLNEYSTSYSWNSWLLNEDEKSVVFRINNRDGFIAGYKIIILTSLADSSERTFSGWFNDDLLTSSFTDSEVSSDTVLYGMFCGSSYTVGLDVNGGNVSSIPHSHPMAIECNGVYGTLPTPARTEHKFTGWSTEREGGTMVESGSEVISKSDHSLYAQWSLNNYSLTFDFDNGTDPEVRIIGFNTTIEYPKEVSKEGYSFNGWDSVISEMPAHNLTITGLWTPNNYTVKFDVNGGSELSVNEMTVTFNETYGALPEPNRSGFVFIEWTTEKNKSVTNETIVSVTHNHTLYAHWEEIHTSQVEIVFGTKDLSEEDIKEIINKYTDEVFTISKYENSRESGETKIIVSFIDPESAVKFVNKLKVSSGYTQGLVRKIDFVEEGSNSLSMIWCPGLILNMLF